MVRVTRTSIVVLLALAFSTAPLLAERCAAACDHAHVTVSASEPSCHHVSHHTAQIGQQPIRCGHDHDTTATLTTAAPEALVRTVAPLVAILSIDPLVTPSLVSRLAAHAVSPPDDPVSRHLSVSLRI